MVTQERNAFATEGTFTALIADIATDVRGLAAAHAQQMATELRKEVIDARVAGIWIGAGAVVSVLGVAAVALGLGEVLVEVFGWPIWAAAFTIGGLALVTGIGLAAYGYHKLACVSVVPKKSLTSIQESLTCLVNQTR